jgi:hypothetical protein
MPPSAFRLVNREQGCSSERSGVEEYLENNIALIEIVLRKMGDFETLIGKSSYVTWAIPPRGNEGYEAVLTLLMLRRGSSG